MKLMPHILFLLLAGCASSPSISSIEGVKVIEAKTSESCEFVSDVHGVSSQYGVFANAGLSAARKESLTQAKSLGANSVVFSEPQFGHGSTSISGKAYRC